MPSLFTVYITDTGVSYHQITGNVHRSATNVSDSTSPDDYNGRWIANNVYVFRSAANQCTAFMFLATNNNLKLKLYDTNSINNLTPYSTIISDLNNTGEWISSLNAGTNIKWNGTLPTLTTVSLEYNISVVTSGSYSDVFQTVINGNTIIKFKNTDVVYYVTFGSSIPASVILVGGGGGGGYGNGGRGDDQFTLKTAGGGGGGGSVGTYNAVFNGGTTWNVEVGAGGIGGVYLPNTKPGIGGVTKLVYNGPYGTADTKDSNTQYLLVYGGGAGGSFVKPYTGLYENPTNGGSTGGRSFLNNSGGTVLTGGSYNIPLTVPGNWSDGSGNPGGLDSGGCGGGGGGAASAGENAYVSYDNFGSDAGGNGGNGIYWKFESYIIAYGTGGGGVQDNYI